MSWLAHILGLDNASGHWYLFWSGLGSDLTEFAIVAAVWHHVNCHEPGCWRPGTRITATAAGVHVRRCGRHHRQHHSKERGLT